MFSRRSGPPTSAILRPAVCCRSRPRWSHPFADPILHSKARSFFKTPEGQNTGDIQGGSHVLARDDTIYALSSAHGKAAIAVIRISGPQCHDVRLPREQLCRMNFHSRDIALRSLLEPQKAEGPSVLDSAALVLYFPGPKTVTGEDVLELHVHGGSATVKAVLGAIPRCSSSGAIRYAEPGEFTKRAFLNDRLDLAQVESLGDMLAAETEQQRRVAVSGNSGSLGRTYGGWRQQLLLGRGEIEALIDFSEDQHFDESPVELLANVTVLVRGILDSIQVHEMAGQRTELLRNGIRIALVGPPNAGKSSLMNQIVGRDASIVSNEAGTTRDVVEASLDIRGYLCSFADTAGFRTTQMSADGTSASGGLTIGAIEQEGIRRAKMKALDSHLVMVMNSVEQDDAGQYRIQYDTETLLLAAQAPQRIIVINKCDMVDAKTLEILMREFERSVLGSVQGLEKAKPLAISCTEGNMYAPGLGSSGSIQMLMERLIQSFSHLTSLPDGMQGLLGVTERQRQLLVRCREHLEDFIREATSERGEEEPDIVLAAEHLRFAADCLARITGRGDQSDTEEVLGVIFEK